MRRLWIFGCILGTIWPLLYANATDRKAVYGSDSRQDLYDQSVSPLDRDRAQSVALVTLRKYLTRQADGRFKLTTISAQQKNDLCPDVRFAEQPTGGFCTSFLVKPDVMVTAGHCVENAKECARTAFVFGFEFSHSSNDNVHEVDQENVYYCKRVIETVDPDGRTADFAVVQLDRPALERAPLTIRRHGRLDNNARVHTIGHPSGLPKKITESSSIRINGPRSDYFVTNLDVFENNSGSPVFDTVTGEVEGILVRGENDYVPDKVRGCNILKICSEIGCRGEDVNRIETVLPYLE